MKYTKATGNSYCNQISWEIMRLINQSELHSQYTFLHIPKTMKPWTIAPEIDQALLNFRKY